MFFRLLRAIYPHELNIPLVAKCRVAHLHTLPPANIAYLVSSREQEAVIAADWNRQSSGSNGGGDGDGNGDGDSGKEDDEGEGGGGDSNGDCDSGGGDDEDNGGDSAGGGHKQQSTK